MAGTSLVNLFKKLVTPPGLQGGTTYDVKDLGLVMPENEPEVRDPIEKALLGFGKFLLRKVDLPGVEGQGEEAVEAHILGIAKEYYEAGRDKFLGNPQ